MEVRLFEGMDIAEGTVEPHRHDYHELIFVAGGRGEHLVDGCRTPIEAPSISVIGRGKVHQFIRAEDLRGALLRFTDAVLHGGSERIASGWLLAGRGGRTIAMPTELCDTVTPLFRAIADETKRPPDPYGADVVRHLIAAILLWTERWYDAERDERRAADDADVQLLRRFTEQLERDFASHHDARHYADALAVPGPGARAHALRSHRPLDEGARDRARDGRGGTPAALHGPHGRRGLLPRRLQRPALLLARVQAPDRIVAAGVSRIRTRRLSAAHEVHELVGFPHGRRARSAPR